MLLCGKALKKVPSRAFRPSNEQACSRRGARTRNAAESTPAATHECVEEPCVRGRDCTMTDVPRGAAPLRPTRGVDTPAMVTDRWSTSKSGTAGRRCVVCELVPNGSRRCKGFLWRALIRSGARGPMHATRLALRPRKQPRLGARDHAHAVHFLDCSRGVRQLRCGAQSIGSLCTAPTEQPRELQKFAHVLAPSALYLVAR